MWSSQEPRQTRLKKPPQVISGDFPFDSGKAVHSDTKGIKPTKEAAAFASLETRSALSRYFVTRDISKVALLRASFTLTRKNLRCFQGWENSTLTELLLRLRNRMKFWSQHHSQESQAEDETGFRLVHQPGVSLSLWDHTVFDKACCYKTCKVWLYGF